MTSGHFLDDKIKKPVLWTKYSDVKISVYLKPCYGVIKNHIYF